MVSTDTVIGVVGAVVLAGAMVAVFYYESQNPTLDTAGAVGEGSQTYAVTWNETTMSDDAAGTNLNEGDSQEHDIEIPAFTARVTITLTWTDNDPRPVSPSGPDTFRIVVTNSTGGEICAGSGYENDDGEIVCEFTNSSVAQPMEPDRVRGNNTNEAQANLDQYVGGGDTWTVTVTLVDTADTTPSQLPGQVRDTTNPYQLAWEFTHWMPELEEA